MSKAWERHNFGDAAAGPPAMPPPGQEPGAVPTRRCRLPRLSWPPDPARHGHGVSVNGGGAEGARPNSSGPPRTTLAGSAGDADSGGSHVT